MFFEITRKISDLRKNKNRVVMKEHETLDLVSLSEMVLECSKQEEEEEKEEEEEEGNG